MWNLSNHKKQSEQFWSIFLRLESEQSYKAISRVESEQSYTAIWAIWAMFSRVESGRKTEMMSAWMLLLLRHNHLKVISVEDKKIFRIIRVLRIKIMKHRRQLRDDSMDHFGWIFWKLLKGVGVISDPKNFVAVFAVILRGKTMFFWENLLTF